MEDIYNAMLKKGWTLGSTTLLPIVHGIIRLYHRPQVQLLTPLWKERKPDLVVSLIPNFNRALFESLAAARPGVQLVTIMTDFADFPPRFWIERQPQHFICGTDRAAEQVREIGHPEARAHRVSGMILRPQFYENTTTDAAAERIRLGLDPKLPTGLVLFGGEGSNVMHTIARRLGDSGLDLQLILICGRNERLRARLKAMVTRNKLFVEGFTADIPRYMHLTDFLIGKPGPGSLSEALKMGLPVVVENNSWTLPQERFNANWVRDHGVGIVLTNFRQIEQAVKRLLADDEISAMRNKIRSTENRAVFEVPQILRTILANSGFAASQPGSSGQACLG
jgi:1,2-diacylglycerol 3-beta-galactosyltransferase